MNLLDRHGNEELSMLILIRQIWILKILKIRKIHQELGLTVRNPF